MSNTTKIALEDSLKRLLLRKPLDKITITDITTTEIFLQVTSL